jgi:hypothetical protein
VLRRAASRRIATGRVGSCDRSRDEPDTPSAAVNTDVLEDIERRRRRDGARGRPVTPSEGHRDTKKTDELLRDREREARPFPRPARGCG